MPSHILLQTLTISKRSICNTSSIHKANRNMTLKAFTFFLTALLATSSVHAFTSPNTPSSRTSPLHAYVPDGLTPEQYQAIKKQDNKFKGKNLGALGPRGFKSRSMQSWQEAYEKGLTGHSIAPFGYREKLNKGEIKKEDVPYMVRGGSWDNSDVRGAKRKTWLKSDVEYARGGYKKEQSVSILGSGLGFDWTGTRPREENLKRVVPGLS